MHTYVKAIPAFFCDYEICCYDDAATRLLAVVSGVGGGLGVPMMPAAAAAATMTTTTVANFLSGSVPINPPPFPRDDAHCRKSDAQLGDRLYAYYCYVLLIRF